jgi:hypothetical protein
MNLSAFRRDLRVRDRRLEQLFNYIGPQIRASCYHHDRDLWCNKQLVNCEPTDLCTAKVIFPEQVHLLPTSAFYDRIYIRLWNLDPDFRKVEDESSFRRAYQMAPADFLELIRAGRVVPIFDWNLEQYTDFLLESLVFPLLTNDLPYMTDQGYSLICQAWQAKFQSFPDPKQRKTWGFLMDLVGAMGIGANLVRPEFKDDIWDRSELILGTLGFDEVTKDFVSRDLTLADFFVATGISYNSRIPVREYLGLFDKVDKAKIFALYNKLDKSSFLDEIEKLNLELKAASRIVDREQTFLKVVSAPIALLFFLAQITLGQVIGKEAVHGLKSMVDDELKKLLRNARSAFQDEIAKKWDRHRTWLDEKAFPDVIDLARMRWLMEQANIPTSQR